jgi:hypothetical protein
MISVRFRARWVSCALSGQSDLLLFEVRFHTEPANPQLEPVLNEWLVRDSECVLPSCLWCAGSGTVLCTLSAFIPSSTLC